ncbi:hypothetical protein V8F20_009326 [Naviculisporaceae sp. PSN 640]
MRPFPGDDAPVHGQRSRVVSSDSDTLGFGLPPGPQMTYFFADESMIGSSTPPPLNSGKDQETCSSSSTMNTSQNETRPPASPIATYEDDMDEPTPQPQHQHLQPLFTPPFRPLADHSGTDTPIYMGKSGPPSSCALSSVSSRRNSFAGSLSEDLHLLDTNVPPSLDGDHDERVAGEDNTIRRDDQIESSGSLPASMMESGSVPQLIMPSIKMPSRRPFTDEGKAMGRLKVMIAGDTGVGKTSLVKAIVQSCEHIVHVDPIGPSTSMAASGSLGRSRGRVNTGPGAPRGGRLGAMRSTSEVVGGTSQITEIYASTKPYPEWWSEIDDFKVLRRRKSLGDSVLDRNICFVDTPGYGSFSSNMDTITPVARYVETHLHRMSTNALADGDMLNLLGGEGGVQVDVVFYMVTNHLQPVDLVYLRQLAPLTNIILLLAQADLMTPEQIATSKEQILGQLNEADIRLFSFTMPSPASVNTTGLSTDSTPGKHGLYAISTAAGSDHDIMDASLLMSPDYVQPLVSSDLSVLVDQVFSQNGAAWLRHAAARKYVQWRKSGAQPGNPHPSPRISLSPTPASLGNSAPLNGPLSRLSSDLSLSSRTNSHVLTPAMGATSSYALARIADHTQREERLAQVRLANWAAELQKSLAKERAQYESTARAERAIWLTEKISECVQDGTLVPVSGERSVSRQRKRSPAPGSPRRGGGTSSEERRRTTGTNNIYGWNDDGQSRSRSSNGRGTGVRWRGNSSSSSPSGSSRRTRNSTRRQQRHEDPLGLLQVAADLRYSGIVALEVLGGLGVLGGLALWLSRQLFSSQLVEKTAVEWERFWN